MPPLVEHIVRDLEENCGFIDLMEGGADEAKQLRLVAQDGVEQRLFEVSPQNDGLGSLPPILNTPYRYWHVLTRNIFSEPDEYDDQDLYVQINVGVGLVLAPQRPVAVVMEVTDGVGEREQLFVAPPLMNAHMWAEWLSRDWPRAMAYAEALVQEQIALKQLDASEGNGMAVAA